MYKIIFASAIYTLVVTCHVARRTENERNALFLFLKIYFLSCIYILSNPEEQQPAINKNKKNKNKKKKKDFDLILFYFKKI